MRELVVHTTIKDCDVQTFRVSGAGGQHRDKTSCGVRIKHLPSGAVGECREHRSQHENKKVAFRRMAESNIYRIWVASHFDTPEDAPKPSERIRTYNLVDNWAKDHRTGKRAPVALVLDGNLDLLR
jgi:protein subunit release factor A